MQIQIILVEPQYPENIGSVARAIKTMGFSKLILINPCDHLSKEAQWLAHGSIDILKNAIVFKSLEEATNEIDFLIATTSKKRKTNFNYYLPSELHTIIENKKESISSVGLIFGREDTGLSNEQLKRADIISTVPIKFAFPSLNLAQTVMIYAYELTKNEGLFEIENEAQSEFKYHLLKERLGKLMHSIDIKKDSNLYNRIFERLALVQDEDLNLMLSFINKSIDKIES